MGEDVSISFAQPPTKSKCSIPRGGVFQHVDQIWANNETTVCAFSSKTKCGECVCL